LKDKPFGGQLVIAAIFRTKTAHKYKLQTQDVTCKIKQVKDRVLKSEMIPRIERKVDFQSLFIVRLNCKDYVANTMEYGPRTSSFVVQMWVLNLAHPNTLE